MGYWNDMADSMKDAWKGQGGALLAGKHIAGQVD